MTKPKLTFYFDLHSPYSYLAYYFVRHDDAFQGCDITYVPVLMVGLVKAGIGHPPWPVPNKVDYLLKDLERSSKESHIPWKDGIPAQYPGTSTSQLQRAIVACDKLYPNVVLDIVDDLYHSFWVEKLAIQAHNKFEPIFKARLGSAGAERVMQMSRTDQARALLKANTEQAIATGAVGLPWLVATNSTGQEEGFWGFDRLNQVSNYLRLDRLQLCRL